MRQLLVASVLGVLVAILYIVYQNMINQNKTKEGWATSPGTLDQLASSSTEYPFWQYQYGFRYPPNYYFVSPYYQYYPYYEQYTMWPKPYDAKF